MNIAQAQRDLKESDEWFEEEDTLEVFEKMITSQMLYRIAEHVLDKAFGEYDGDLPEDPIPVGNYIITIEEVVGTSIIIKIEDKITGDISTIEVPYYNY